MRVGIDIRLLWPSMARITCKPDEFRFPIDMAQALFGSAAEELAPEIHDNAVFQELMSATTWEDFFSPQPQEMTS